MTEPNDIPAILARAKSWVVARVGTTLENARVIAETDVPSMAAEILSLREERDAANTHASTCLSCNALAVVFGTCAACHFVQRNAGGLILSLRAQLAETQKALSWALDILDMNDERLIGLGDSPQLVHSQTHLAGKAKARATLNAGIERREKE